MHDRSHTPHCRHTTLTPVQEAVAVVIRKILVLSIDNLEAVVPALLNLDVWRSGQSA